MDLELVAAVRVSSIVRERLRTDKVMVRRRSCDDVAVAGNLASEARDRACDLVDFAEEAYAREAAASNRVSVCLVEAGWASLTH